MRVSAFCRHPDAKDPSRFFKGAPLEIVAFGKLSVLLGKSSIFGCPREKVGFSVSRFVFCNFEL